MSENPIIEKVLLGEEPGSEPQAKEEIKKFLTSLGNPILGLVPDLVREEMKKRMSGLEKDLANMRRQFGEDRLADYSVVAQKKNTPIRKSTKSRSTMVNGTSGGVKPPKKTRGQVTDVIMESLASGPKSRAEIVGELNTRHLSTQSLGTLLNRMKKNKTINHDVDAKVYSLPAEQKEQ